MIVVEHGATPVDDLYFELKPGSINLGEVDYDALIAGRPQTLRQELRRRLSSVSHRRRRGEPQHSRGRLRRDPAHEGHLMLANLITDVEGVRVGSADDARIATGVTAVLFDEPATASIAINGGSPALRETALLEPEMRVEHVDAFILSGGSAFGLDAGGGAMAYLAKIGRGFVSRDMRVPIVPGASLFDLANGGDKAWGRLPPYLGAWLPCGRECVGELRAWDGRRGPWRDDLRPERRARLGKRRDLARLSRRGACRGQFGRQGDARRERSFLGGALRARRRVRGLRLRSAPRPRRAFAQAQDRFAVQHRPCGRGDGRAAHQAAGQAHRHHGAGRLRAFAEARPRAGR